MKPADGPVTVADALAMAEAWNERAAMLSTLGFELRTIFAPLPDGGPPAYLVTRISGGASPADPERVEDLRAELFSAAERARDNARRILAAMAETGSDHHAPAIGDQGEVAPRVNDGMIRVPSGGDEIVGNPACPPSRRKLGDGPRPLDGDDDSASDQVPATAIEPGERAPRAPVAPVTQLRTRKTR